MDTQIETPESKRNPETYRTHRKEFLWQIMAPLILGVVLILVLMGFSVSPFFLQNRLADIALIWLILPMLLLAFLVLITLLAIIYGLQKLTGVLPEAGFKFLGILDQVKTGIQQVDDRLVSPIIRMKASSASLSKLMRQIFRR